MSDALERMQAQNEMLAKQVLSPSEFMDTLRELRIQSWGVQQSIRKLLNHCAATHTELPHGLEGFIKTILYTTNELQIKLEKLLPKRGGG